MSLISIYPLLTGFFLGLSLIVAIGAQNVFVLRQGILREHVFYIALFCSISDAILIILGIAGISYIFHDFFDESLLKILFGFSALMLIFYGLLKVRSSLTEKTEIVFKKMRSGGLMRAISIAAVFTFANPHVYLDTLILIGSISQKFNGADKILFAFGACMASFVWFFGIGYGAKLLTPIMQNKSYWRLLDLTIALIMFLIALNLLSHGGWI